MLSAPTIQQPVISEGLSPIQSSILRVLLYFKVFNHPLKKQELFQYVCSNNKIEVQTALANLIGKGYISCKEDFIWVMNERYIIQNRLKGNDRADAFLKIAKRQVRLLSLFPFIKCICISGSLSKMYMDDHSDIDYFIIAKKRRLWLTKVLISAIVETLEFWGFEKYFCPNYIITEDNLEIEDKNVYTAIEIITLIPLYNQTEYRRFLSANEWIKNYFPHYEMNLVIDCYKPTFRFMESFFKSKPFTLIDSLIYKFYRKRFDKKVRQGKIFAFENDMVITENNFKLHLSGHRHRILKKYQENIWEFEDRFGISVTQN